MGCLKLNNDGNGEKGNGMLVVQVFTADQTLPISDATVIVSKSGENGETLVRMMKTNENGKTETIKLPAPPAENSLSPGNTNMFNKHNIRVDYPGYYTTENLDVPIFEGRTSIQPISLVPLPEGEEKGKTVTVVETEPPDLG